MKPTLIDKIKYHCTRTKYLRNNLMTAMRFQNQSAINDMSHKLANNNALIADLIMDLLERVEKADPAGTITAAINANIEVSQDTPMNVHSIDRYRGK